MAPKVKEINLKKLDKNHFQDTHETLCTILYHLYNLKNVKMG